MKPLEVLNQDMDKVLQGDLQAVTRNFRWEELNSLLDLINSSLQRVTRSSSESNLEAGPREITAEEFLASIRAMSDVLKAGIVVCGADQRVIYMNNDFETISGIRSDRAMGQTLSDAAVDQGFSQLIADMLMRCEPGGQAVSETCEFGGVPYRAMISAFGPVGSGARCFLVAFVKAEY